MFYVKQCRIPETSPRSLGSNTGRSGFSEPGCHRLGVGDITTRYDPSGRGRVIPMAIHNLKPKMMLEDGGSV